MTGRIVDLVLDESKWLTVAMLAAGALALLVTLRRRGSLPSRDRVLRALNLYYGTMIGVLGLGHLAAVALKAARGDLAGSLALLVALGLLIALPACWLALRAAVTAETGRTSAMLNAALGIVLLALGVHNAPLAAPAALNLAYQFHSKRAVGWTLVAVAVAGNAILFAGSLVFFASGQTFEQFDAPY